MPLKDMATSTAAMVLIRTVGGTVGISVGQAIWSNELRIRIAKIAGFTTDTSPAALTEAVRTLKDIQPDSLRQQVLHAYTKSIATIWIVDTPIVFVGFIMSTFTYLLLIALVFTHLPALLFVVLFVRKYTLKRTVVRSEAKTKGTAEPTAGLEADEAATGVTGEEEHDSEKDEVRPEYGASTDGELTIEGERESEKEKKEEVV